MRGKVGTSKENVPNLLEIKWNNVRCENQSMPCLGMDD
jgi:hypothetical protein